MTRIAALEGRLVVDFDGGTARFHLGQAAAKWADKLVNPPSVLDKLGIKAGSRVSALGGFDAEFVARVRARTDDVSERGKKDSTVVLLLASTTADLDRLPSAMTLMARDGGVWIVYPKGQKSITQNHVMDAGRGAGLTDNKVASFSDTHTALRFVIPVAKR
jgi:hypothetical protein